LALVVIPNDNAANRTTDTLGSETNGSFRAIELPGLFFMERRHYVIRFATSGTPK
jgi:hypothetical protein